jgi:methylated-DNA-[protein]-cysteine S-methyltransferase
MMKKRGKEMNGTCETMMPSPIGRVLVAASEAGITRMEIAPSQGAPRGSQRAEGSQQARAHVAHAIRQLKEYFAGKRREFDLPLDLRGTPLQQRVWRSLLDIPFGKTMTYGELARRVGTPKAARAAGAACGANPVWLVVPCHRVIGSDGGLHGYGGGLWRKEFLLKHEGALPENRDSKVETRKSRNPRQQALFQ